MCEPTVLRFFVSLKEAFSNSIYCRVVNNYDKGAAVQILRVFQAVYHVLC